MLKEAEAGGVTCTLLLHAQALAVTYTFPIRYFEIRHAYECDLIP